MSLPQERRQVAAQLVELQRYDCVGPGGMVPMGDLADGAGHWVLYADVSGWMDELLSSVGEFVDAYAGRESHLGNGQARRSLDRFRSALAAARGES